LVSWNVNGIRACVRKGFSDYFKDVNADIFCIQETKLQEGQIALNFGESTTLLRPKD
jgi:exodeoxyribonuclease-3